MNSCSSTHYLFVLVGVLYLVYCLSSRLPLKDCSARAQDRLLKMMRSLWKFLLMDTSQNIECDALLWTHTGIIASANAALSCWALDDFVRFKSQWACWASPLRILIPLASRLNLSNLFVQKHWSLTHVDYWKTHVYKYLYDKQHYVMVQFLLFIIGDRRRNATSKNLLVLLALLTTAAMFCEILRLQKYNYINVHVNERSQSAKTYP